MKRFAAVLTLFLFTTALPVVVMAQGDPPGLGGPAPEVPIDGGLGILAAAGGAYAIKKLREQKK